MRRRRLGRVLDLLRDPPAAPGHEYGIFGSPDGEYVLSFAHNLSQPLVSRCTQCLRSRRRTKRRCSPGYATMRSS